MTPQLAFRWHRVPAKAAYSNYVRFEYLWICRRYRYVLPVNMYVFALFAPKAAEDNDDFGWRCRDHLCSLRAHVCVKISQDTRTMTRIYRVKGTPGTTRMYEYLCRRLFLFGHQVKRSKTRQPIEWFAASWAVN